MNEHHRFNAEEKYGIIEALPRPVLSNVEVCRRHGIGVSVPCRSESQQRACRDLGKIRRFSEKWCPRVAIVWVWPIVIVAADQWIVQPPGNARRPSSTL